MGSGWHDVRQGESVESIAAERGRSADVIWNDSHNSDLRNLRKDPHILMPGDRLFIPDPQLKTVQVATGSSHKFVLSKRTSRLQLQIRAQGDPRKNEPYLLTVDGKEQRGTTDGDGRIDVQIPASAERATLVVGQGDKARTYDLALRAMDPVTETTGLQARLRNLGYAVGRIDGKLGPRTEDAIRAFQQDHGLSVTGQPDDPLRAKLADVYGC
jgi:hypothetical protein